MHFPVRGSNHLHLQRERGRSSCTYAGREERPAARREGGDGDCIHRREKESGRPPQGRRGWTKPGSEDGSTIVTQGGKMEDLHLHRKRGKEQLFQKGGYAATQGVRKEPVYLQREEEGSSCFDFTNRRGVLGRVNK